MRFDRGSIMAPIGSPSKITGRDELSIGGLGGGMDFDTSQFLTRADLPTAFDDRALRERIGAIEDRYTTGFDELNRSLGKIPAFDDSELRNRLSALEGREVPAFDPSNLQTGIAGLRDRLDNLNIPEYKAPDLSGFARLEDLPQIDTSKFLTAGDLPRFDPKDFREDFLSIAREGIQMPEYKAPDLSGFARKEDLPVFDKEAFEKEILDKMRGSINVSPKPPVFDRDALIKDIRSGIDIPKPPSFDREKLIEDVRAGIDLPQAPAFDPTGLQDRLKQLEERLSGLQTPALPEPAPVGGGLFADPATRVATAGPGGIGARPDLPKLPRSSLFGGKGVANDFMSIDRIPTDPRLPIEPPRIPKEPRLDEGVAYPGGSPTFNEQGSVEAGNALQDFINNQTPVTPTTDPVTTAPTPSAPISDQGTDPIQSMPVGALDPVLLGQTSQENLSDPLVRALYFGTADQPGFYQQLQQAGANLIGQDVPLQQTAGLTPLELLARQQAVAGLGGFEPFLQQNRDLVEQAIAQSRRAEELQDPYYTQAEEIYKDTMGAYDPSMTQQFYNPFEQAVVDKTIQDVMEAGEKQDIASRAREISAGAFGGSRARLGAMERQEALGEGLAQALGRIRQQGFSEAQRTGLGEFARQQAAKRTGAEGLMGIGMGRGSAASALGSQLAGYGSQIGGIGSTQEGLRAGQRGELAGFGATGRGIAETGLSRIYQQQLGQQQRPLGVLGQIGSMLPGYQQTSTQIGSKYGLPTDPSAAGLGAAFSAYGALAPRQGQS